MHEVRHCAITDKANLGNRPNDNDTGRSLNNHNEES